MPTVRKMPQPPPTPDMPLDLAGVWRWQRHGADGQLQLQCADFRTRWYAKPERAIAEARRWVLSRPKPIAQEVAPDPAEQPNIPEPPRLGDLGGWRWEVGAQGMRLTLPEEGYVTAWQSGDQTAACIVEARQIAQHEQPAEAAKPLLVNVIAEQDGSPIRTCETCHEQFIPDHGESTCPACAQAWRPGPDERGVYRRPTGMPERAYVPLSDLADGRWQPRKQMNPERLAELTESIKEHGILEDLIAIVNEAGQLELIAGHRRRLAALHAGLAEVPVKIVEKTLAQARALAIVSNDDREDLNDVERGQAYETIIRDEGISEAELARRLSRPRSYIQQRRAVGSAETEVRAALVAGEISFSQARGVCAGAGGDGDAQRHALGKIKHEAQWRTATEKQSREWAEKHVTDRAEDALKALGWQIVSFYANKLHTFIFGGSEKPAQWTAAQMLAAIAQQRRPQGKSPAAPAIAPADETAIRRRGWEITTHGFGGWILAKIDGKPKAMHGDELAQIVQTARADLTALADRYVKAGWRFSWDGTSAWVATSQASRAEHDWGYAKAEQLIKQIEAGKVAPAPPPAKEHCASCGADLRDYTDYEYHHQQKICHACHRVALQREADERTAVLCTLPVGCLRLVPDQILHALFLAHSHTDRVLFGRRMSDAQIADALAKRDRQQIEQTLLSAIAWQIWEAAAEGDDDDGEDDECEATFVGAEGGDD